MKSIWAWLATPHASITDLGERWRVQLSMGFALTIFIGMMIGPIPMSFMRRDNLERSLIIGSLGLISLIAYILGRTRFHHFGAVLLVFGLAGMGFSLALTGQSPPSDALNATLPMVLVLGSGILSLRGLFFLTIVCGFGPLLLLLPAISSKLTNTNGISRDSGIFLVIGALLMGITIWRNRLETKRLGELKIANQSLQAMQSTLEERVIERTTQAEQARLEAENARLIAEKQAWFTQGQALLAEKMRGEQNIETLANNVTGQLCKYLGAQTGALFLAAGEKLKLTGRYAYAGYNGQKDEFGFDENLTGEAAKWNHMISISNMDGDVPLISSALGNTKPKQLLIAPIGTDQQAIGVVELATLHEFSDEHHEFLRRSAESIAIAFHTAQTRERIASLLLESQMHTEELQAQEEELRAANEALMAQAENRRKAGH